MNPAPKSVSILWALGNDELRAELSGARLVSITGPAGTGKGHASRAMTAIWQRQGRRVIAAALPGRTARQAEADSGADVSYTLEKLGRLLDAGQLQLQPTDVLLVDEAGVIDHHTTPRCWRPWQMREPPSSRL